MVGGGGWWWVVLKATLVFTFGPIPTMRQYTDLKMILKDISSYQPQLICSLALRSAIGWDESIDKHISKLPVISERFCGVSYSDKQTSIIAYTAYMSQPQVKMMNFRIFWQNYLLTL